MLGMLYEPGLPGYDDLKRAVEYFQKAIDCGNTGCAFYLARVYAAHMEELGCAPGEIRNLLEQAEPVEGLKAGIALLEQVNDVAGKLMSYAMLRQSANVKDPDAGSYVGRIMAQISQIAAPEAAFRQWAAKLPGLAELVA